MKKWRNMVTERFAGQKTEAPVRIILPKKECFKAIIFLQSFSWKLPRNCLSVFVHFVGLALKGLFLEYLLWNGTVYEYCISQLWQFFIRSILDFIFSQRKLWIKGALSDVRRHTIAIHTLSNILRGKGNQVMKLGQLLEYNMTFS